MRGVCVGDRGDRLISGWRRRRGSHLGFGGEADPELTHLPPTAISARPLRRPSALPTRWRAVGALRAVSAGSTLRVDGTVVISAPVARTTAAGVEGALLGTRTGGGGGGRRRLGPSRRGKSPRPGPDPTRRVWSQGQGPIPVSVPDPEAPVAGCRDAGGGDRSREPEVCAGRPKGRTASRPGAASRVTGPSRRGRRVLRRGRSAGQPWVAGSPPSSPPAAPSGSAGAPGTRRAGSVGVGPKRRRKLRDLPAPTLPAPPRPSLPRPAASATCPAPAIPAQEALRVGREREFKVGRTQPPSTGGWRRETVLMVLGGQSAPGTEYSEGFRENWGLGVLC